MRRLVLLSFVALSLAACGKDAGRAFTDSRTPPSLGPRFWAPEGWAWGVIAVKGAPEIRYGVAAPAEAPRGGGVIIVTGYGESAEVYFETVRDLNARGLSVWVIEPHGQGGSGRFPGASDAGRSAGFDKDAAAIRTLVEQVIRPAEADEVLLAAHGSGALPALLAVEDGLRRVDRLFLWDPDLTPSRKARDAVNYRRFGLGFLRAEGRGWRRPAQNITRRATLPLAWPVANLDLRLGGPGWSWIAAEADAIEAAASPAALKKVDEGVVMMGSRSNRDAWAACSALPNCAGTMMTRAPNHLSSGADRQLWLTALVAAAEPAPR